MNTSGQEVTFIALCDSKNYDIASLEDEIRADQHTRLLLKKFHLWLLETRGKEPLEAGYLAAGADYFLREFLIGAKRLNIFDGNGQYLRHFGGNWYIINNLEPNLAELSPMLTGAALFYSYCAEQRIYPPDKAAELSLVAKDTQFFKERIASFHQIEGDGYQSWDRDCPLT